MNTALSTPPGVWMRTARHDKDAPITGFKCAGKDRARYDWANERVPEIPEGCPRYLDTQMSPLQSTVIVSPWTNRIMIKTAAIPANSVFIDDRELNVGRAAARRWG